MKQTVEKYVEDLLICVEDTKGFYINNLNINKLTF